MSYSDIARDICPPRDRQGMSAPVKTGRAARRRVGTFNSPARRRDVLQRLTDRVNAAAGVLTVDKQLRDRGADSELVRRYASSVGRKAAAAYRAETDTDPAPVGLAVAGRHLVWAAGYQPGDSKFLDRVIDSYELADPNSPIKGRKAPRVHLTDLIGA